jgi:hypothetical protein
MLARSITSNVQRLAFSSEARMRAALKLYQSRMPMTDIASLFGVTATSIARDVGLGLNPAMMKLVEKGYIAASTAASLLQVAKKFERIPELCKAVERFGKETEAFILREKKRRKTTGGKSLSVAEQRPRKYLTGDQVRAWSDALRSGASLSAPSFEFFAGITTEGWLQIDKLKVKLSELEPPEVAKVLKSCTSAAVHLADVLKNKSDRAAKKPVANTSRRLTKFLQQLGVDDLIEQFHLDDEAVEPTEEESEDSDVAEIEDAEADEEDDGLGSVATGEEEDDADAQEDEVAEAEDGDEEEAEDEEEFEDDDAEVVGDDEE